MPPHRIRLRGFWTASPLPDGRTRHARPFGAPRPGDLGETVWVVGESLPGPVSVALNGTVLGEAANGFAFDVTGTLQPRNELVVETPSADPPETVAVEIRSSHSPERPAGDDFPAGA